MNRRKLAIYGGTFNPPHLGHVAAAKAFKNAVNSDSLLIIPTFTPPHKAENTECSAEDRLNMCIRAFSGIENTEISDMEIRRGGKSYTYATLRTLGSENCELYFLVGTDMFVTIDEWMRFEEILGSCTICLARRDNDAMHEKLINEKKALYTEKYNAKIMDIYYNAIEISSTEIRNLLHSGHNPVEYLPDGVFEYIKAKGLYK